MFRMLISIIATFTILSGAVSAHMVLEYPKRFQSVQPATNGPMLGPTSAVSNYPCRLRGDPKDWYAFDFPRTQLPSGGKYTLATRGTVVHGGGSCQMSLTKDLEPSPQSIFKVIHSVHGGCPGRKIGVNREPADANATNPDTYDFPIPAEIEPGDYTFAWTWFNNVGNREMYMNCAPVTVTSNNKNAKRDSSFFDGLPNIHLANIPGTECTTTSVDNTIFFPHPGDSLETNDVILKNGSIGAMVPSEPVGANCLVLDYKSFGPAPLEGGQSPAPASPGVSAPTPAAGSGTYPQQAPYTNSSSSAVPSMPNPAGSGSGSCPSTSVSCPTPGNIVCVGANQFGLCDMNNCAIVQALASGTSCSGGVISKRSSYFFPSLSLKRHSARPHNMYHRYMPRP